MQAEVASTSGKFTQWEAACGSLVKSGLQEKLHEG